MKKYLSCKALVLSMCLLMAVLLIGGCSNNAASTVTSSPDTPKVTAAAQNNPVVKIGIIGGQTGPAAAPVTSWISELENVLKYTNEVEGGIDGLKLEWKIADDKGTPEGSITAYKELRDTYNPPIFIMIEDYYLTGIKDTIVQDQSTFITSGILDPTLYNPPSRFFSIAIPSSDGLAGYVKWVKQNWQGTGQPKIGVLYWGLGSGEMTWNLAKSWVAKQGVETIPLSYQYSAMDFKSQLMRLRDSGATHIWVMGNSSHAALIIRDMKGLDLTGKIPVTFSEMAESDVVIGLAGADAEGYTFIRSESAFTDNSQAAQLYSKIWDWAGKQGKWADSRLQITMKAVITAAVKQAAADVGKENIDKIAIYNALNKLTSIDTWGNSQNFGYGPDRRLGVQAMQLAKVSGDRTVSVSDFITLPRTFEGIDK